MSGGRRSKLGWALLLPALLFLGAFLVVPLILLALLSFRDVDALMIMLPSYSLAQYVEVFTTAMYREALGTTLWVALVTTVFSLVLAYPCAYMLTRAPNSSIRAALYVLLISPLLTSVVVRTFGWIVLLAQNGLVNQTLLRLGLVDQPLPLLWNMKAVIVAYVQVMLPFAVLPIATALGEIDPALRRASMALGASRIGTFLRVTFPLTIPGLASGTLIVFSLAAGSYITPMLIGGNLQPLLPITIYQQTLQVFNLPLAGALSLTLLVVVGAVVALLGLGLKRWEARLHG